MPFDRDNMKAAAAALAKQGVFIGTSSWKYPGWRGQLYHEDRYIWHGKLSEARFERLCLALPSHCEQSNWGLCASFMAELGGL
jgi:hypothetical protein